MAVRPIKYGLITSNYGDRILNKVKQFHPGIDIGVNGNPLSIPVYAAKSGIIVWIDNEHPIYDQKTGQGSFGRVIYVKLEDGYHSIYPHLYMINHDLNIGQNINEGDFIGIMGNTGLSIGPHLHYEERPNLTPGNSRCPQDIIDLYK